MICRVSILLDPYALASVSMAILLALGGGACSRILKPLQVCPKGYYGTPAFFLLSLPMGSSFYVSLRSQLVLDQNVANHEKEANGRRCFAAVQNLKMLCEDPRRRHHGQAWERSLRRKKTRPCFLLELQPLELQEDKLLLYMLPGL